MSEQHHAHPDRFHGRHHGRSAVVATGILLAACNNPAADKAAQSEQAAVARFTEGEQGYEIINRSIRYKAGVNVRHTPYVDNGTPETGNPGNIAFTIGSGQDMTVSRLFIDENHEGFYGFVDPRLEKRPADSQLTAKDILWVAHEQLKAEAKLVAGNPLFEVIEPAVNDNTRR